MFDFDSYGTAHIPEDKDQFLVQTPYGTGRVIKTRTVTTARQQDTIKIREVELIDWNNNNNNKHQTTTTSSRDRMVLRQRPPTLYSPTNFPSIPVKLHDQVVCTFGRGKVIDVRKSNTVVVLLSSWRLAGRSRVTCYLSAANVQVVQPKKLYDMSVYEKVEFAQEIKQCASQKFALREYATALDLYVQAIEAVKYVQHRAESPNEMRADLLLLLITCYNNAGTCCSHLSSSTSHRWDEAARHAKNALILIEALEEKKGMKIHTLLQKEGWSDLKLFGEWKVKALLLRAKACYHGVGVAGSDTEQAMELLKQAHRIIVQSSAAATTNDSSSSSSSSIQSSLLSFDKEVKKLHVSCKERRKQERIREKKRAMKMFATPSPSDDDHVKQTTGSTTCTSTTNGHPHKPQSSPSSSSRLSPSVHKKANGSGTTTTTTTKSALVANGIFSTTCQMPQIMEASFTVNSSNGGSAPPHQEHDHSRPLLPKSNSNSSMSSSKRRVSFSEHVNQKLYQPDEKVTTITTNKDEGSGGTMMLFAGLGVVLGTVATVVLLNKRKH